VCVCVYVSAFACVLGLCARARAFLGGVFAALMGSDGVLRRRRGAYRRGWGAWWRCGMRGRAVKSQMRGNCFESQQIWWSEIRVDDGGGGVIRISVCVCVCVWWGGWIEWLVGARGEGFWEG